MEPLTIDTATDQASQGEYALASGAAAVHRLFVLHNIYGPAGRRLLLQAGLKRGMHVADFGCGVGAVTRMLGEMVGPSGSVTGIDVSARPDPAGDAASALSAGLVQRRVSRGRRMRTPGFRRHSFDLVYCRFLLLHLTDPGSLPARDARRV